MAEARYVIKSICEIFDFSISTNSGLTKAFVNSHKGTVPVYGASQNLSIPSYGYIQDGLDGIKYFDDCLTYNKDGASGLVFFRTGHFTISEKVVPLVFFDDIRSQLDCDYIKYAIENESRKREYTFSNKATKVTFKNIKIKIPVCDDGTFDLSKQISLAERYKEIERKRLALIDRINELKSISVLLPEGTNIKWTHEELKNIFSEVQRGNSKFTKSYCRDHEGDYPVYSADNKKPLATMNSYDYDGEYLTISINGLAGKVTILNEKFSTTADRVVCIPNENIDIRYIMHVAEPILRNKTKGRKGDLGKNEFTKLTPDMIKNTKIPIPITEDGIYDLKKQIELSAKYDQINKIKSDLSKKLTELTNIVIS